MYNGAGAATLTPTEGRMRTSERDGGKLSPLSLSWHRFEFQMLEQPVVNLLPNRRSSQPCLEQKMALDIAGIGGKLRVRFLFPGATNK